MKVVACNVAEIEGDSTSAILRTTSKTGVDTQCNLAIAWGTFHVKDNAIVSKILLQSRSSADGHTSIHTPVYAKDYGCMPQ